MPYLQHEIESAQRETAAAAQAAAVAQATLDGLVRALEEARARLAAARLRAEQLATRRADRAEALAAAERELAAAVAEREAAQVALSEAEKNLSAHAAQYPRQWW